MRTFIVAVLLSACTEQSPGTKQPLAPLEPSHAVLEVINHDRLVEIYDAEHGVRCYTQCTHSATCAISCVASPRVVHDGGDGSRP